MSDRRKLILVLGLESLVVLLVVVIGLAGLDKVTHQEDIMPIPGPSTC